MLESRWVLILPTDSNSTGDVSGRELQEAVGSRSGVLERCYAILDAFRPSDHSLSAAELARRTELSRATAHRIIQEMVALGILDRADNGVKLGMKLFEWGQMVPLQWPLKRAALPFMLDLREATRATVHLAVLRERDTLYLEILQRAGDLPSRVGGRVPAHATGVGKAMLAFSPNHEVDKVMAHPLQKFGPNTITDPAALRREFSVIRRERVAYDLEEAMEGLACVAAPILTSGTERVLGAISVAVRGGEDSSKAVRQFAPAVHMSALGIARVLERRLGVGGESP